MKAGVSWYGRLAGDAAPLTPQQPIGIASQPTIPVLGLYGGKDTGIPIATVEKMRDQLKSSRSKSEIVVYPEAPHAFFADYRPSYREAEARDGWKRLQAWFKQSGVGIGLCSKSSGCNANDFAKLFCEMRLVRKSDF